MIPSSLGYFRVDSIHKCIDAPFYVIIAHHLSEDKDYYIVEKEERHPKCFSVELKVGCVCKLSLTMIHPIVPDQMNRCDDWRIVVGRKYTGEDFYVIPPVEYDCFIYSADNIYGKFICKKDVLKRQ